MREDVVVKKSVNLSGVQYAVIEVLHTETGRERMVLAYHDEQSLRDLIAAPSIIALGFTSRAEAIANRACSAKGMDCHRTGETVAGEAIKRQWQEFDSQRHVEAVSVLRRLGQFLVASCGDLVTSATVIFSSSNFISTAIRLALGSSV
jgi:hypothetical protein